MLTPLQIAQHAYNAGFRNNALSTAVAIALAESNGNELASNHNAPTAALPEGSVDRGLWQINSYFHAEVADRAAYNPQLAAIAAYRISTQGTNFTPWAAFTNGKYKFRWGMAVSSASEATKSRLPVPIHTRWWHKELKPWLYLSQFLAPTTVGYPSDNRQHDCGPTCLSMILYHLYGIHLSPDVILAEETWQGYTGDTTDAEAIHYLNKVHKITCTTLLTVNHEQTLDVVHKSLKQGFPVIARGLLNTPSGPLPHFTVTVGITPKKVITADPNDGLRHAETYAQYRVRSLYEIIIVNRKR